MHLCNVRIVRLLYYKWISLQQQTWLQHAIYNSTNPVHAYVQLHITNTIPKFSSLQSASLQV